MSTVRIVPSPPRADPDARWRAWQDARIAYDAQSGIARRIPTATRAPIRLSPADRAWVEAQIAKRRRYLAKLAERLGLDPEGVFINDTLEAAVRRAWGRAQSVNPGAR